MRKLYYISFLVLGILCVVACQDNTGSLGADMMPKEDITVPSFQKYPLKMESYKVDSLLSRTGLSYLGSYADPETETVVKCDFISQYHMNEGVALFPNRIINDNITGAQVCLYVKDFVGDPLAPFKLSVYDLDTLIDSNTEFYTSLNPMRYIDDEHEVKPISSKWYTLTDQTITDDEREAEGYSRCIRIDLPREKAQQIYDAYRSRPESFANTYNWVRSGLTFSKGLYFKLENGDGAVATIDITQIHFFFRFIDDTDGKEYDGVVRLSSTEEVIQATSFENQNVDGLLADTEYSYLKTPAGVFTMVTLPIDELNMNDTINMASVSFTRANRKVTSAFETGIPTDLLMVRYDDYRSVDSQGRISGYFEKYSLPDKETSYLTTFNSDNNTYTFSNISRLLSACVREKKMGIATENYNKVLLIPVNVTLDNNNQVVKVNHDFKVASAKLIGGKDRIGAWMEVVYSNVK